MADGLQDPVHLAHRQFHGQANVPAALFDPNLPQWLNLAQCQYVDPELFFPHKGGQAQEAKRICGVCKVKNECREYSIARPGLDGVWGGLSEKERKQIRRERGWVA